MITQMIGVTARSPVAGDKPLLAMDERNPTCNKRCTILGITQTEPIDEDEMPAGMFFAAAARTVKCPRRLSSGLIGSSQVFTCRMKTSYFSRTAHSACK